MPQIRELIAICHSIPRPGRGVTGNPIFALTLQFATGSILSCEQLSSVIVISSMNFVIAAIQIISICDVIVSEDL